VVHIKKQRARDKSEFDVATAKIQGATAAQLGDLQKHGNYFTALGGILSTLIENVNM